MNFTDIKNMGSKVIAIFIACYWGSMVMDYVGDEIETVDEKRMKKYIFVGSFLFAILLTILLMRLGL